MKIINITYLLFLLSVGAGCEQNSEKSPSSVENNNVFETSVYVQYTPTEIDILPLTEIVRKNGQTDIKVFVSLLDSFGSQIKMPGAFRFELYEKVPHSSEAKGKRHTIWPDTDLSDLAENNTYWRDFLRAYEFNLDIEIAGDAKYILQVTFLSNDGKHLTAEMEI